MNTYMHVTDTMQKTVADAMGKLIKDSESQPNDSKVIQLSQDLRLSRRLE